MMKKNSLILLLLLFTTSLAWAQTVPVASVTIKGQVLDSLTNDPVIYATIKIMDKKKPLVALKVDACNEQGKFQLTMPLLPGEYILNVTYIGKQTLTHSFANSGSVKTIDLGTLILADDAQALSAVTVTANRPLVKVDLDKITYSLESDPESKTNNVLDMLKKVPLVTVDGDENIQLKGSSNYKIYLNGKPSNMLNSNPKDVLRGMPANTVKDIQIITDPGAKYDAEGVAGIINIVTLQNVSTGGYTGTVNAGIDSQGGYRAGLYAMVKSGKIGFTGSMNQYQYKQPDGEMTSTRKVYNTDNAIILDSYMKQYGTSNNKGTGQYGSGELSYEIDTLNLLHLSYNRHQGKNKSEYDQSIEMENGTYVQQYAYDGKGLSENTNGSSDINLDYQHSFSVKDRLLTASYQFSLSPNDANSENEILLLNGTLPQWISPGNKRQNTDAKSTEHTSQTDFTTPFAKIHTLEAGIKYILRLNESNSGYTLLDASGNWVNDPISNANPTLNQFEHRNDIVAAYTGYSMKLKQWGVKAGLRYEYTALEAKYALDNARNFDATYSNLVPSATVTYQLKPMQNIRIGYNMRISRPGIGQLNPYVNNSNPSDISYGNPNLDAVKYHSLNANYGFFTPKINLNLNMSYNFANNTIESILFVEDNVSKSTYDNIGKRKDFNLSGYISYNPTLKLRISSNMSVGYVDIKSNNAQGMANSGIEGRMFASVQYKLPGAISVEAGGGYFFPQVSLQGEGTAFYFHGFSLRKAFLKDKLNVQLRARNPFTSQMTYTNSTSGEYFYQESRSTQVNRNFGISVSYRFGELKTQIKKATRGISNDDVQQSSGQGQQE